MKFGWIKYASGWFLDKLADSSFKERFEESEKGWLGEISKKKPEDAMRELPQEATDPFLPERKRLRTILSLYNLDPRRDLFRWAVEKSGLEDPLSTFSRDKLMSFFRDFIRERDIALIKLLEDMKRKREPFEDIMKDAPKEANLALQRLGFGRK